MRDGGYLSSGCDDSFGKQKAKRKIGVLAGRAHGNGNAFGGRIRGRRRAELYLQWLFDGDLVAFLSALFAIDPADVDSQAAGHFVTAHRYRHGPQIRPISIYHVKSGDLPDRV
jgi:hypothetical protein